MDGVRSIQAPDEQKLPLLSAVNDCVTSGAVPPRMAATILSSLIPPTVFTAIAGWDFSNCAITPFTIDSSRPVKPTQIVIVVFPAEPAGRVVAAPPAAVAPSASAASDAAIVATRLIVSLLVAVEAASG